MEIPNPDLITHVKASRCYSVISYLNAKKLMLSYPLCCIEKSLNKKYFFRVHRSFLINLLHIVSIDFSKAIVKIRTASHILEIPISRSRKKLLKKEWEAYYFS